MAPKGKAFAVSKTKRANHLKQKKTFKAGAKISTFGKRPHQNNVNGRHNAKHETNFNGKHVANKSSFGKTNRVGSRKPAAKGGLVEDEIDADLGAYILLKKAGRNDSIKVLLRQFKNRHGIKFDQNLLERVKNYFS